MYIERDYIREYPFSGRFYTTGVDESKPLEEQVEEEIEIPAVSIEENIPEEIIENKGGIWESVRRLLGRTALVNKA